MRSVEHDYKFALLCLLTGAMSLLISARGVSAQQAEREPVKVFVLAGQSNMQGQGEISPASTQGTLQYTIANDPNGEYQFLVDANDNWATWDDVWMHYERSANQLLTGPLTAGYGVPNTTIGPELGFNRLDS